MRVYCDYCGRKARLVDSAEIYGRSYGMAWVCWPCDAYVGCHKNSKKHAPLGRLANARLRELKKQAHAAFDPLWKCGERTRKEAYGLLALLLNIPRNKCHIGMFDESTCERAITLIKGMT